jgi:hypothetical protein
MEKFENLKKIISQNCETIKFYLTNNEIKIEITRTNKDSFDILTYNNLTYPKKLINEQKDVCLDSIKDLISKFEFIYVGNNDEYNLTTGCYADW